MRKGQMTGDCDHSGFHSGMGKLAQDLQSIRFVVVCDFCGEEMREVHVESYAPDYDPSGNARVRRAA
jgi:hypothetical protein